MLDALIYGIWMLFQGGVSDMKRARSLIKHTSKSGKILVGITMTMGFLLATFYKQVLLGHLMLPNYDKEISTVEGSYEPNSQIQTL